MKNKKEGLHNYLEYSFNSILNIFYRLGYRALDPEFSQNRIHITALRFTKKNRPPPSLLFGITKINQYFVQVLLYQLGKNRAVGDIIRATASEPGLCFKRQKKHATPVKKNNLKYLSFEHYF